MASTTPQKGSPLKSKPLRNPGQSLDEEIERLTVDEGIRWGMVVVLSAAYAAVEWWRWRFPSPPNPLLISVLAALCVGGGTWRLARVAKRLRLLKQGRDGERIVGQELEELRAKGCRIFHDIPGGGFNLDHVVVSTRGIFVVETKTLSKRPGDARIRFDGVRILADGVEVAGDYLTQARAEADWLRKLLREWAGRSFPVRAVLVFPGWYVERTGSTRGNDVWVLNPKLVGSYLDHEPVCLRPEEVAMIAERLRMYVEAKAEVM